MSLSGSAQPAGAGLKGSLRREAMGFAAAGLAGLAVDAGLTVLLVRSGWLSPVIARIPATAVAIGVTYVLNRHFSFRSNDQRWGHELLRYAGVNLSGAAVNYACYVLFLFACGYFGLMDSSTSTAALIGILAGSAAAACLNFIGSRSLAFVKRESARSHAPPPGQ